MPWWEEIWTCDNDDFSCFTWILFLAHKNKALSIFSKFYHKVLNEKNTTIVCLHSDHGAKFENQHFENFYNENEIEYNFFVL